jgi:hypothetical protein
MERKTEIRSKTTIQRPERAKITRKTRAGSKTAGMNDIRRSPRKERRKCKQINMNNKGYLVISFTKNQTDKY